jgi:hypothetical protein
METLKANGIYQQSVARLLLSYLILLIIVIIKHNMSLRKVMCEDFGGWNWRKIVPNRKSQS